MPSLRAKTMFVGALVGLAHIISGIAVLMAPEALNVTPLAKLHYFVGWGPQGVAIAAILLIVAGYFAVAASVVRVTIPRVGHLFLFLPQQILLVLQVWTITVALNTGQYPDGYVPQGGGWFILTDQIWAWILAVSHSIWLSAFLYGGRSRGITGSS